MSCVGCWVTKCGSPACPVRQYIEERMKNFDGTKALRRREWVATLQFFYDRAKFFWGFAEADVHMVALKAIIADLKKGGKL